MKFRIIKEKWVSFFVGTLVIAILGIYSISTQRTMFVTPLVSAQSAPGVTNITDNRAEYAGQSIPKHEKIEITFNVNSNSMTNPYVPYDPAPPAGVDTASISGVTVTGFFKNPNNQVFEQPGFYYEVFDHQVKNNDDWWYATGQNNWKIRFSPDTTGQWQYWITVQDANGTSQTNPVNFTVGNSSNKGFVQVSPDPRYFEFEDGTYFPGLGYNSNFTWIDWFNPTNTNTPRMEIMQENGIQLTRIWASHWNIYGTTWAPWRSNNPVYRAQEPNIMLSHPNDGRLGSYAPQLSPPSTAGNRDFYLWLNHDETTSGGGSQPNFNPCRVWGDTVPPLTVKRNTDYRLIVRYRTADLSGPKVAGQPFGFVVKRQDGNELWHASNETARCYYPGTGTVLGASYPAPSGEWNVTPDASNPGWSILQATFHNGAHDFIRYLYLTLENLQNDGVDASAGHAFIDEVRIEEIVGGQPSGVNIMPRSHMDFQQYVNQRHAAAFDYVLNQAEDHDVYFKAVMLDKNDYIFQSMNFDGTIDASKTVNNFYGDFREGTPQTETQARWWQKAWWRYMQGRWGYSSNIHSWELLNEGNDGPAHGPHWVLADEFGKYMKCGVFNQPAGVPGNDHTCAYKHPNSHMTTTSFFAGSYPFFFWKNQSGNYSNLDYADRHYYPKTTDSNFYDEVQNTLDIGAQYGAYATNWSDKPFMRGETAWNFGEGTDLFAQNATDGVWLHNLLWAGLNPTGVFEQYWLNSRLTNHIFRESGGLIFDHRPKFGPVYNFIKDIPLNNTHYEDATPQVNNDSLRVVGQKDLTNKRAHLWIQNKNRTWKNVYDGVSIPAQSGAITIGGFNPSTGYSVQWWNTSTGAPTTTQTITTNGSGQLVLSVTNLATDTAVRIGTYSQVNPTPTPGPGSADLDEDGDIDVNDFLLLAQAWFTGSADLTGDGVVNSLDFYYMYTNFDTPGGISTTLSSGAGQAVSIGATLPDSATNLAMRTEAITEAFNQYQAKTSSVPKAILFVNNAGEINNLISLIQSTFNQRYPGQQVPPIGGTGTGLENYNSFTLDTFVEHGNRSMAVLVLGGSSIEDVIMVQKPIGNPADYAEAGRQIATDLQGSLNPSKTNLIHMFGPGHNPQMTNVLNGMKEIFGSDVPDHIKIIGSAAYVNGSSTANGSNLSGTVTGVLLKGTFNLALAGKSENPTVPANVATALQAIKTELQSVPEVTFFVPGHPSAGAYATLRQTVVNELGASAVVFGHEGGGEYGHLTSSNDPIAVPNHFFIAGLGG